MYLLSVEESSYDLATVKKTGVFVSRSDYYATYAISPEWLLFPKLSPSETTQGRTYTDPKYNLPSTGTQMFNTIILL